MRGLKMCRFSLIQPIYILLFGYIALRLTMCHRLTDRVSVWSVKITNSMNCVIYVEPWWKWNKFSTVISTIVCRRYIYIKGISCERKPYRVCLYVRTNISITAAIQCWTVERNGLAGQGTTTISSFQSQHNSAHVVILQSLGLAWEWESGAVRRARWSPFVFVVYNNWLIQKEPEGRRSILLFVIKIEW